MKLHEFKKDFRDLISATSQHLNIREVYIEKDYWVTYLLKRLSHLSSSDRIVFKGGTSLSKGYNLIKRFSEDVDLAVVSDGLSNAQVERLIKKISKELTQAPFVEIIDSNLTSKKGLSYRTVHSYPRQIKGNDFGPVRENILLEINCFGKPTPNSKQVIRSFILEFLLSTGQNDPIDEFELLPFEVIILDYKRTFVEKLLSLSYASLEDENKRYLELRSRIRHFYDLTILFDQKEIRDFVHSVDFVKMIKLIRQEEKLSSRAKWNKHMLCSSDLHLKSNLVLDKVSTFYKSDLEPMLFNLSDLPDFKQVKLVFNLISKILIETDT